MDLSRRDFALWLAMTKGIGGRSVSRILARCDLMNYTPEELRRLVPEALQEEFRLTKRQAESLADRFREPMEAVRSVVEPLSKLGVHWVTFADAHYPARLEAFDPDPPGVLFMYGNTNLLKSKTVCVLSSRNTSPVGLDLVEKLAETAVLSGEVIVSGHDTPEYQRAAVVPLRWGAPRILCLDRGLFKALGENLKDEPFRAARLWRYEFDPKTDLVISPFRPNADYVGINNQVRDRLIVGLADRVDAVEISPAGNMERYARMALKAGRKVRVSDRSVAHRVMQQHGAEIFGA